MALPPSPTPHDPNLPASARALISPPDDPRDFRRFPLHQESGIRPLGEFSPWEAVIACAALHHDRANGNFHSVKVRNLSMTGLYFATTLPYRAGLRMEIKIPLCQQLITVVGVVRRLDQPAFSVEGRLSNDHGCGVDFIYSLMSPLARRAIMEFLLEQAESGCWHELPYRIVPPG